MDRELVGKQRTRVAFDRVVRRNLNKGGLFPAVGKMVQMKMMTARQFNQ